MAVRNFKKADLEAVILAVDPERERISLGVKQLEEDPMGFLSGSVKGAVVKGTVTVVEVSATVDLGDGVIATLLLSVSGRRCA